MAGPRPEWITRCWPGGRPPELPMPAAAPGTDWLLLGPVRAAEHPAEPFVQRVADLVQRAHPVHGGAVGRRQLGRLRVVEAAPDVTDRDQLDLIRVDEPQAPVRGHHDPVEEVAAWY